DAVLEGLQRVVHGPRGTARNVFRDFEVTVAGKTGSAETPRGASHGWFGAIAPADDPEVVVVVLVEHGGGGARAAAPIAREILAGYFRLKQEREGRPRPMPKQAAIPPGETGVGQTGVGVSAGGDGSTHI